MKGRVAIVELNDYHDEVIPSFVRVLSGCGFGVDVFTTKANLRKNAFCLLEKIPNFRLVCLHRMRRLIFLSRFFQKYTAVFFNSIEPFSILGYTKRIFAPLFLILHNAGSALSREMISFRKQRNPFLVTLSSHVSRTLRENGIETLFALPSYVGPIDNERSRLGSFIIQGALVPSKRNFGELVEIIPALKFDREANFFQFVGMSSDKTGVEFKRSIAERGLSEIFRFSNGKGISFREFYSHMLRGTFILPLIDHSMDSLNEYYHTTISSSITLGIALGLIPVVEVDYARLFGIEDFSITYDTGHLGSAINQAIRLSEDEKCKRRKDELKFQDKTITEAEIRFSTVLSDLVRKQGPSFLFLYLFDTLWIVSLFAIIFVSWLVVGRSFLVIVSTAIIELFFLLFSDGVMGFYNRVVKKALSKIKKYILAYFTMQRSHLF